MPENDSQELRHERLIICPLDPLSPEASQLIRLADIYLAGLYPADSNHSLDVEELLGKDVVFLGAFYGEDCAGCAAVRFVQNKVPYAELKKFFVKQEFRNRGVAGRLLAALEEHVRIRGINLIRLETGVHQPEALALYEKYGYGLTQAFGDYEADPLSVFMGKDL